MGKAGNLQNSKVGEVVDISAKVRLRASEFLPLVFKSLIPESSDLHRSKEVCDLESSCKNNDVEFLASAALARDAR